MHIHDSTIYSRVYDFFRGGVVDVAMDVVAEVVAGAEVRAAAGADVRTTMGGGAGVVEALAAGG